MATLASEMGPAGCSSGLELLLVNADPLCLSLDFHASAARLREGQVVRG